MLLPYFIIQHVVFMQFMFFYIIICASKLSLTMILSKFWKVNMIDVLL